MTVSSLCTYQHLTDKHNNRKQAIDRITPHQMCAHWTGKRCADYFCETDRQCSANYCIGYDGDIAQNVDEDYRAWTSSSQPNDTRAITVELANVSSGSNEMTDATIEAFINLCVDLFQRYPSLGGRMNYTGNESGNITLHRFFKDTNCPGSYFESKLPYIQEQVNAKLGAVSVSEPVSAPVSTGHQVGDVVEVTAVYTQANGGKKCTKLKYYKGTITKVKAGAEHPYLIDNGNLGWCGESDIKQAAQPVAQPVAQTSTPQHVAYDVDAIAREVINGKWGNGAVRKVRLAAAGYDYKIVQARVNELCK